MYYLGKGKEFKKEECKEYKTLRNAMAAAEKDKELVVWDETGKAVNKDEEDGIEDAETTENGESEGKVENVPSEPGNAENEANTKSQDIENESGKQGEDEETGTEDEETAENGENEGKVENVPSEPGNDENEANTKSQDIENESEQQNSVIIIQGTAKVTVVCDGALNLRRSPAWGNKNICGRAVKGQSYYVKEIHMVDGKKMVRTIDDLYLSGQSGHVKIEQL